MAEHRPENLFRKTSVALLVGMGEIVSARRARPTQGYQQPAVQPQPVADVVETDGMGELGVDQAHQMAPRAKGAHLLVHSGLPRQLRHQRRWNQIANLPQHGKLTAAWKGCCFFHPCRVAGQTNFSKPFS